MNDLYYNLDLFGKEVRSIRHSLNLTQRNVSKLTGVNVDTLRKIENGKVIPKQETLDSISIALKKDLNCLLLKYRLNDYQGLIQLKNNIELKLENGNFANLEKNLIELKKLVSQDMNIYFKKIGKQFCCLIESIVLKINDNNYLGALDKLIEAMEITMNDFSIFDYNNFLYNKMEIRILMNIALILNKLDSKERCLEILLFCLRALDNEELELKIRIYYNLSYAYHRLNSYENTLYYATKGIDICVKTNSLSCLALLHYRKGIAEYFLKNNCYMDSLKTALSIYELSGQHKLKDMLINSCNKFYAINI